MLISGSFATYLRLIPSIKKRYDYGVMIFLLTFNLVVVSVTRVNVKVWELAGERLLNILMGLIVCVCVNLLVFPLWASDELHDSIVSRFLDLANTIQGIYIRQCHLRSHLNHFLNRNMNERTLFDINLFIPEMWLCFY